MFILVDDEDRENEGDLVIPAQMATPDAINFMATLRPRADLPGADQGARRPARARPDEPPQRHAPRNRLHRLDRGARRRHHRHFRRRPRAHRLGRDRRVQGPASDIVTPGHVFPLVARDGGVLVRAGPYRGGGRRRAARRAQSLGRDLRDHERGRHDGAAGRPRRLRAVPQSQDRHDPRPDRLSPPPRPSGREARRGALRPATGAATGPR